MESSSSMTLSNSASGEVSVSSSGQNPVAVLPTSGKKKRNLPGMPDPDAEVIALSPRTLTSTNRFVCEICHKGFQRDQNLQLHRRGHNLPWKLRQRTENEPRKRVYVCPEPSCVHHDPSRALGDLTGIKKHFFRKHGEKKWKCDKCSKNYAVQSDLKAHSKVCGTREYRCDCGTLFSRRDSFITHRAFCDALAQENVKGKAKVVAENSCENTKTAVPSSSSSSQPPSPTRQLIPAVEDEQRQLLLQEVERTDPAPTLTPPPPVTESNINTTTTCKTSTATRTGLFASLFTSTSSAVIDRSSTFTELMCVMSGTYASNDQPAPTLSNLISSRSYAQPSSSHHMSATALLQKAAEMGAASTTGSLLRGLGLASSSSSTLLENYQQKQEQERVVPAGLGLGLRYEHAEESGNSLSEMVMDPATLFGPKQTTLDFLGLGSGDSAGDGLSALMTSVGGGLDLLPPSGAQLGDGKSTRSGW